MRIAAGLLLLAALCSAAKDVEIKALVEELGSSTRGRRHSAYLRLAGYGEEIIPILRAHPTTDPDVIRMLRALTRVARTVKLRVTAPSHPQALGGALVLDVRLINDTDDSYHVPLVRNSNRGTGTKSAFFVQVVGQKRSHLLPDQVEWVGSDGPVPILKPRQMLRVIVRLTGESSPLRRPGSVSLKIGYDNTVGRWYGLQKQPRGGVEQVPLTLTTEATPVHAQGRKPGELDKALRSEDAGTRVLAIAELSLREDDAILPVLRRNAGNRSLRLAAVRRLGAKAHEQDFGLIYAATRDADAKVRVEAVRALANYKGRKARSKLIGLAQDHELRDEAIQALKEHRHGITIQLFIRLLRQGTSSRASIEIMCRAIQDWTGMPLTNNRREIARFEQWWSKNRIRWAKANAQR